MVRDGPKLPNNSGECPKPNGAVDNLIPGCDIFST